MSADQTIRLAHWHKNILCGVNGQGKSVLFRALIRDYLEAGARVVLYDSEKELSDKIPRRLGVKPDAYLAQLKAKWPGLTVYTPRFSSKVKRIVEFDSVCGRLFDAGRVILAVESIEFYAPTRVPLPENLEKLIQWGRNMDIGLLATLRRPASANSDIGGLMQNWFVFHLYSYNDQRWLRAFLPGHLVDELVELQPFHFIHWTQDGATRHNPIPEQEAQL